MIAGPSTETVTMRVDVAPVELRSAARALAALISSGWLFGVDVLLVSNP